MPRSRGVSNSRWRCRWRCALRATATLLLRLLIRRRIRLRFKFLLPLKLWLNDRKRKWLLEHPWKHPPIGAAVAAEPVSRVPAAVAMIRPPVTHVFFSTSVSFVLEWRDGLTIRRTLVLRKVAVVCTIPAHFPRKDNCTVRRPQRLDSKRSHGPLA